MKYLKLAVCLTCILGISTTSWAKGPGSGYMGGTGKMVKEEPTDTGGMPGDVEGPLNDKISTKGQLYGDLYVILRYNGTETKNVPRVDENGEPVMELVPWTDPDGNEAMVWHQAWDTEDAVGGEPVLTENFVDYQVIAEDTGEIEINPLTGGVWFSAPTPSQCVQPLASFARWGDLSADVNVITGVRDYSEIESNKIPLTMTYDPTWGRTEFAVGMDGRANFIEALEAWTDPTNGMVVYQDAVTWSDLIQEVSFGRLNQARAPVAVHQAAFDEAISSINSAVAIGVDASGRIVLTKEVYDDILVDESGDPMLVGTVNKAIDSPLENLSLYLKVMQDGHILTPGDEREPIDRSGPGGIPISMMLEMEDGPSTALRPTLTQNAIIMLRDAGLGHLVPAEAETVTYYTWTEVVPVDGEPTLVLHAAEYDPGGETEEWFGIPTKIESSADSDDFESCAAFLSAAADKTGKITINHVVYLNSIMGLNKVVGMSEDGTTDYTKNPVFYDFSAMNTYDRGTVFNGRPWHFDPSDSGDPLPPTGEVIVLQYILDEAGSGTGDPAVDDYLAAINAWAEYDVPIISDYIEFREYGLGTNGFPDNQTTATENIAGFAQQIDDDLSVIEFVHTYQIPENR